MDMVDPRLTAISKYSAPSANRTLGTDGPSFVQQQPPNPYQLYQPHPPNMQLPPQLLPPQHQTDTATVGISPTAGSANIDHKRSRACESCRSLKVRCVPDDSSPYAKCRRCAKANRECIFTAPSRKRHKRTDSRVAELEKKINAMSALLKRKGGGSLPDSIDEEGEGHENNEDLEDGSSASPVDATNGDQHHESPRNLPHGIKRGRDDSAERTGDEGVGTNSAPILQFLMPKESLVPTTTFSHDAQSDQGIPRHLAQYSDVVDRRLLSMDMATQLFDRYANELCQHFPAVVFSEGTTAGDVRRQKPTLFLAVIAAAAGTSHPDLNRSLNKEIVKVYADRIVINGEKSLELIQAILVTTLWYYPPDHFEELKFYQYIHIAAAMALDIGIGKKTRASRSRLPHAPISGPESQGCPTGSGMDETTVLSKGGATALAQFRGKLGRGMWRDNPWRRNPFPDANSIESRRTLLSCYFCAANAAMALRRPNMLRFTNWMAECVEFIEKSADAAPTDRRLVEWVKIQRIAEEAGTAFAFDDPSATVSLMEPRVQFTLKGFEKQLEDWKRRLAPGAMNACLNVCYHVKNIYLHEIAMHIDHNVEDFRPPFLVETIRRQPKTQTDLTPAHIDAIMACLASTHALLDTFLEMDVETLRAIPIFNYVRTAYSVVVLIKLFFSASAPKSDLGKVLDRKTMKVNHYLDKLLMHLKMAAGEEKSRPASKFLMILTMLKTWYHRQRMQLNSRKEAAEGGVEPMRWIGAVAVPESIGSPSQNLQVSITGNAQPSAASVPLAAEYHANSTAQEQQLPQRGNSAPPVDTIASLQRHPSFSLDLLSQVALKEGETLAINSGGLNAPSSNLGVMSVPPTNATQIVASPGGSYGSGSDSTLLPPSNVATPFPMGMDGSDFDLSVEDLNSWMLEDGMITGQIPGLFDGFLESL